MFITINRVCRPKKIIINMVDIYKIDIYASTMSQTRLKSRLNNFEVNLSSNLITFKSNQT